MSRGILVLLSVVAALLAGCAPGSDPSPSGAAIMTPGAEATMSQFTATPVAGLPQCSRYSVTATINGKPQALNGEACRQPDGSWHIAEQPVYGGTIYQTVYWPPPGVVAYNDACFDAPYDYPCLYGFPFGFSIGFPVFIDIHHHFHHFIYNARFHSRPMGHFGPIGHFGHVEGFHGDHGEGFHGDHGGGFHGDHGGGFHGDYGGGFHGGGFDGGGFHGGGYGGGGHR